jgi:nucleotide-binding universal stress UspA family protein
MFKRILVPVDGSATANAGLQQALAFARDQKAALRIVHVVDEAVLAEYPETAGNADQLMATMKSDGRKTLDKAIKVAARYNIKAESVMYEKLLQPLTDLILKEAKKWRADIIIMGTHGREGIRRLFMGSEAEAIVRGARIPVLLVHAATATKRSRAPRKP